MKERGDVLERNLALLLRRAYAPVAPSADYRRRLERALDGWLADAGLAAPRRRSPLRPVVVVGLAAAAAVVALLAFGPRLDGGAESRAPRGLAGLLAEGAVALRAGEAGAWRAATAEELERGVAFGGGALDVATPAGRGARVAAAGRWEAALAADGRARFEPDAEGAGERVELRAGALAIDARDAGGTAWVAGEARAVLERGRLALALEPAARVWPDARGELARARLDVGSLRLACGDARAELDAPAEALAFAGALWDAGGLPLAEALDAAGEPGREALAQGAGAGAAEGAGAGTEPADEGAPPGATLRLRVRSAPDGAPVAGFRVALLEQVALPRVGWPVGRAFADEGGAAEWRGIAPATYDLSVAAPGFAPWKRAGLTLAAGDELELAVELSPGGVVRGFVVDRASGAPLEGALVVSETDAPMRVLPVDTEELPPEVERRALTAADGSFELRDLAPGAQRLRASRAGYGPEWAQVEGLRPDAPVEALLIELGPGGAVHGRAEQLDGRPHVGARIVASRYSGPDPAAVMTFGSAMTDADGRYRIEDLAAGDYVVLCVGGREDPGDMRPKYSTVRVDPGTEQQVDFLGIAAGARLHGRVLRADGTPLDGWSVMLVPRSARGWSSSWSAATTEADGAYELTGLAAGAYHAMVGRGMNAVRGARVELAAGEQRRLELRLPAGTLRGRARDARDERGVSDVVVIVRRAGSAPAYPESGDFAARLVTERDGRFAVDSLPPGRYELLLAAEDEAYAFELVEDVLVREDGAPAEVEVRLRRGGALVVTARDPDGAPLAGARVTLRDPLGRSFDDGRGLRTAADGTWRARGLAPGRWTCELATADGAWCRAAVDVAPETTRERTLVPTR